MIDLQGREIRYLRLSITRSCAMRCSYCRPEAEGHDQTEVLTPDEIVMLVRHLVATQGLKKVRLTGGEPSHRAELVELIRRLGEIRGLDELAMTTNGLRLAEQATALAAAGLQRVNVSLDSLCPENFARITGVDGLERVLRGIEAAVAAGLTPVKLNTVVLRGANDHELPELVRFAAERALEIRFIELMPMGPLADQWEERFLSESQMRRQLASAVAAWQPLPTEPGSAHRFRAQLVDGTSVAVGFITPISCPFCSTCDRVRITSDGTFFACLMDRAAGTLLSAIRPQFNARAIDRLLEEGMSGKAAEHPLPGVAVMTHLGG